MIILERAIPLLAGLLLAQPAIAADAIQLATGGTGTSSRIESDLDSWVALAMVLASLVTAWCLNAAAPTMRAVGTLLASVGCLAIALWFFVFVMGTGFLENPKPNQTPLDSAKPAILWAQGSVALMAGLLLLVVGLKQTRGQTRLALSSENEAQRYGRISRFLHWTTAILFISLIPIGVFASIIPEGTEYRNAYFVVHKTIGVLVFMLVIARLIWNMRSRRPGLNTSLRPIERKMAHSAHITLYFFLIALPVTGFVMTSFHGYPTFFFFWDLAPLWAPSETATIIWGTFHKYLLPYILYIVLGAHVLGALKHHFVDRHHDAIKRMVG